MSERDDTPPVGEVEPWHARLLRSDRDGSVKPTRPNALLILEHHPACLDLLALDERAYKALVMRRPPWASPADWRHFPAPLCEHLDVERCAEWLQLEYHAAFHPRDVLPAMLGVAHVQRFDPVRRYLDSVEWDGERERCEEWLINYCGAEDTPLNRAISKRWLISAVARVYDPGCQVDTVLVLEGKQGGGKSSAFRILACNLQWYRDEIIPLNDQRQAANVLQGAWIYEIAEFASFRRADQLRAKSYLTRRVDNYLPPYARVMVERPRSLVFGSSTNEDTYLTDTTGLRRYWPVHVADEIDKQGLASIRDQLWAEAVAHYRAGTITPPIPGVPGSGVYQEGLWWFAETELREEAAEAAESRRETDVIEEVLARWADGRVPFGTDEAVAAVSGELHGGLLGVSGSAQSRVTEALRAAGYTQRRETIPGQKTRPRVWVRRADVRERRVRASRAQRRAVVHQLAFDWRRRAPEQLRLPLAA